jgi:agmatine deiminase
MSTQRLPAEWEHQDAVLLLWPHKNTQWEYILTEVFQLYEAIAAIVCDYAKVVIVLPDTEMAQIRSRLQAMLVPLDSVYFYSIVASEIYSNTWIRDYGAMAVETVQGIKLLDFTSNARHGKYSPLFCNKMYKELQAQNEFSIAEYEVQDWLLDGGAIATDGQGTLLAMTSCVFNKSLNIHLNKNDIENRLKVAFGVNKVNWLEQGCLGEIYSRLDDLVRLCPNNTIVYTACDDEQDIFYDELKKMAFQLAAMTNAQGEPYRLLPLPWPGAMFNDSDKRLCVSYASFFIVNAAVLVPIYNALSDEDALDVIFQAFPGFDIIGIPCENLIEQGGSLHRITMQLPEGIL